MKTLKPFLHLALAAAVLPACTKDRLEGSGTIVTQDRGLPAFQNVLIQGPVKVNVMYGNSQLVRVRTDAVAVNEVITTVSNNTLVVDIDDDHHYQHISFEVDVTLPVLHRLTHLGVSHGHLSGFQGVDALEVVHQGVGDLTFHGSAGTLHITHDGVGDLHAFGFAVDTCHVAHSGVGRIEVNVQDQLTGSLSGVGSIYYQGSPQVSILDSGVGQVVQVN